jgi:hypothetical protein
MVSLCTSSFCSKWAGILSLWFLYDSHSYRWYVLVGATPQPATWPLPVPQLISGRSGCHLFSSHLKRGRSWSAPLLPRVVIGRPHTLPPGCSINMGVFHPKIHSFTFAHSEIHIRTSRPATHSPASRLAGHTRARSVCLDYRLNVPPDSLPALLIGHWRRLTAASPQLIGHWQATHCRQPSATHRALEATHCRQPSTHPVLFRTTNLSLGVYVLQWLTCYSKDHILKQR